MDHSIRAYLERRTSDQLLSFLAFCLQNRDDPVYCQLIPMIKEILQNRESVLFPESQNA